MSEEIKVGDKVRVREDAPKIYTEGWSCDWLHAHSNVRKTEGDSAEIELDCFALVIPLKYLIKVEEEAKEPTEAEEDARFRQKEAEIDKFIKAEFDRMLHPEKYYTYEPTEQTEAEKKPNVGSIKIPVEVDLTDGYWDAYTADLAKEIALKVANKYNDPKQLTEYAVKCAKAVAEGLKRK